jgi:hypothetical protein
MHFHATEETEQVLKQEPHEVDADKLVIVYCLDPKWGRNPHDKDGLYSDVLSALQVVKHAVKKME